MATLAGISKPFMLIECASYSAEKITQSNHFRQLEHTWLISQNAMAPLSFSSRLQWIAWRRIHPTVRAPYGLVRICKLASASHTQGYLFM